MKKVPLTRRTPLKAKAPLKRKTWLKRVNPKTKRENQQIAAQRAAYAKQHDGDEVHEIIGGKSRRKTKQDRRFWLAVKRWLHKIVQYESKARQCARKLLQDPENFDLDAVNAEYRDGGEEWPITWTQIAANLRLADE